MAIRFIFPSTLEEWNYNVIRKLVIDGYSETDTFEFKSALKYNEEKYNEKLMNTVCAFANSDGGFIVFGIEDAKNKQGEDRIVGLDWTDFPPEFGNKFKAIDPTVYYQPKNPPIKIDNKDKFIYVVHIPRSTNRPHMVPSTGKFYYRTNGGNKIMNYHEVKAEFLAYGERRNKLYLFFIEIISNIKIAEKMFEQANKTITDDGYLHFSTLKFETDLMNNLLPDILLNNTVIK
jgi:predicted HTH transcriptional regulator